MDGILKMLAAAVVLHAILTALIDLNPHGFFLKPNTVVNVHKYSCPSQGGGTNILEGFYVLGTQGYYLIIKADSRNSNSSSSSSSSPSADQQKINYFSIDLAAINPEFFVAYGSRVVVVHHDKKIWG